MLIGRAIGWLLIVLAVAAAGHEWFSWLEAGSYRLFTLGDMWAVIDRGSLALFEASVPPRTWPWLWNDVIVNAFRLPAWAMLVVPGAALAALCRPGYGRHSRLR